MPSFEKRWEAKEEAKYKEYGNTLFRNILSRNAHENRRTVWKVILEFSLFAQQPCLGFFQ